MFNMKEMEEALIFAIQGYFIILVVSSIAGFYFWRFVTGRRGTFVMVVVGLLNVFFIVYYGSYFWMLYFTDLPQKLDNQGLLAVSLLISLVCILLPIIPLRILLNETKSPLLVEFENLTDEQMSPLDVRRKDNMAKRAGRGTVKPPRQI